ncbi:MAG: DUF4962 domain-containing protein [Ruminococcaceae bacterium]|nr:DUF4962 domain-containing protein [Oscillospiraceae bacterium]
MSNDTHDMFNDTQSVSFPQERQSHWEVFPYPTGGVTVYENPPAFVWLPLPQDTDHTVCYTVTVEQADGTPVLCEQVYGNTYVPTRLFSAGSYRWNVTAGDAERGWETFTVAQNAIPFIRPTADEVLQSIPEKRPRHLFSMSELAELKVSRADALDTLRRCIEQAYRDGLPARPQYHTDEGALPYREYFGRFRDFCDRSLVACALGYYLLGDKEAGAFAKRLFLHICDWNPGGPCSLCGAWGDEVGLSCARCFPAVFDLTAPLMNAKERAYAAQAVVSYAQQCEDRLLRLDYMKNPGNSHAGRLPAYLGEAALSLWGEPGMDPAMLRRWLAYALQVYGGMFPFFGTPDGGWAEGTFYSTSYTKWYLPFFSAVARYTGKSFFDRPFYRNFARYLLHFALPDHELHPFGDGYWCSPESPEWPGFFAQNPFRVYADVSGLEEARAYDRALSQQKLFSLHLLDVFLPTEALIRNDGFTAAPTDADAFPDAGFVSLHSGRRNPAGDLHLMARASKFGPGSHRQPDNGSFALFAGGTAMLCPSGYFGRAYGTKHHMQWLNTTKAHNAILVDGIGQDFSNFRHTAEIVSCGIENGIREASLDMTASYPMLTRWVRTFRMTDAHTVVIEDDIRADHPVEITYPLHMLSKPADCHAIESDVPPMSLSVTRHGHQLLVTPDNGCFVSLSLSDRFDVALNEGEPEQYHVQMPSQYHAYYTTDKKCAHHLRVVYRIF